MKMKNTTQQPLKWKWIGPIDNSGKFHRLKWVELSRLNFAIQYFYVLGKMMLEILYDPSVLICL